MVLVRIIQSFLETSKVYSFKTEQQQSLRHRRRTVAVVPFQRTQCLYRRRLTNCNFSKSIFLSIILSCSLSTTVYVKYQKIITEKTVVVCADLKFKKCSFYVRELVRCSFHRSRFVKLHRVFVAIIAPFKISPSA